jgi:hypothetical protein
MLYNSSASRLRGTFPGGSPVGQHPAWSGRARRPGLSPLSGPERVQRGFGIAGSSSTAAVGATSRTLLGRQPHSSRLRPRGNPPCLVCPASLRSAGLRGSASALTRQLGNRCLLPAECPRDLYLALRSVKRPRFRPQTCTGQRTPLSGQRRTLATDSKRDSWGRLPKRTSPGRREALF